MGALTFLLALLAQQADFVASTTLARVELRGDATDITASDLELRENGALREIVRIARDELPLDLVLLIDTSRSMKKHYELVVKQAHQALEQLKPQDRLAIISFKWASQELLPLTSDRSQMEQILVALDNPDKFYGGTMIVRPITRATELLKEQSTPDRRRALLMISDGDGFAGASEKKALIDLWEADISLHAFVPTRRNGKPARLQRGRVLLADLPRLIESTSGEVFPIEEDSDSFAHAISRIRRRTVVYFTPAADTNNRRKVEVKLSDSGKEKYSRERISGRREFTLP
jgi:hypothetical protein